MTSKTVSPYTNAENRWTYRSRRGDFERTMPLYLRWEVNGSPMSDDYSPGDIGAADLLGRWASRYGTERAPIYWTLDPAWETAPFQTYSGGEPILQDFLTHFYWPTQADTGERLNFLRLPVLDFGWRTGRADKGGFIQEATGWKPSPLQPELNTAQLFAAAGLARPTARLSREAVAR